MTRTAVLPPVSVDITVEDQGWLDALPDAEERILAAVAAAFTEAGLSARPDAELSVVLAGDAMVRGLNRDYRGKDAATNVLSFPAGTPEAAASAPHLGDIVLGLQTVRREAEDEDKPLGHHLAHLMVHGVLHLFGYDHDHDEAAERMEALERRTLATLGVPDPYADAAI